MPLNLLKTAAGVRTLDALAARQAHFRFEDPEVGTYVSHSTRNWPKRAEALAGGSIYWILGGEIAARNRILALRSGGDERGPKRCQFLLDPALIPTVRVRKRAIQGWRYFETPPADLPITDTGEPMPESLAKDLKALGLL